MRRGELTSLIGPSNRPLTALPGFQRLARWSRVEAVRDRSHDMGYEVGEDLGALFTEHGAYD